MKTNNEDITADDYQLMGDCLSTIINKAKRAQQYGEDMRSSRLIIFRDIAEFANKAIKAIDQDYSEESK